MDAEQQQQQAPQDGQVLAPAQGLGGIPPGPEPPGEQVDGVAAGSPWEPSQGCPPSLNKLFSNSPKEGI